MMPRRPVRRAFTGLAGSPLAVTTPAPPPSGPPPTPIEPAPTFAPLKPGPKPKYGNDNERKLAHKKRKQEPERQRLIGRILNRIRQHMSKPDTKRADSTFWKVRRENKEWLTSMRAHLDVLTYVQIKTYYDVLVSKKAIGDLTGRLPGERSGEASQSGGMSELEVIFAAIVREENGGGSVGHGVDADEVDDWDDSDSSGGKGAPRVVRDEFEDRLEQAARVIAEREWDGPRVYEFKVCNSIDALTEHVSTRFRDGEKSQQMAPMFREVMVGEGAPRSLGTEVNRYFTEVYFQMAELEKADTAKGAKARKLERLAREARQRAISSPPVNPT